MILFGALYQIVGLEPLLPLYAGALVVYALFARRIPSDRAAHEDLERPGRLGAIGAAFRSSPGLAPFLGGLLLLSMATSATDGFVPLQMLGVGGGPFLIGVAAGLAAVIEIPIFTWSASLGRRLDGNLFLAGAIVSIVTLIGYSASDSPAQVAVFRTLAGVGFGLKYAALVVLTDRLVEQRLRNTGQALMQMAQWSVGPIVGPAIGGFVYVALGPPTLFAGSAAVATVGAWSHGGPCAEWAAQARLRTAMSDPVQPALRHYEGFFTDSSRWERFTFRPGDVVISTPAKCGTTWMQTIVGMLLLGPDRARCPHRCDLAVARHADPYRRPCVRLARCADAPALHQDPHAARRVPRNTRSPTSWSLGIPSTWRCPTVTTAPTCARSARSSCVSGSRGRPSAEAPIRCPRTRPNSSMVHRQRRAADRERSARFGRLLPAGPHVPGRARRGDVHLFHYADLWADRDGEMRRVAAALGVPIDGSVWPAFIEAAGLTSMRARAADTAPDADMGIWVSPEHFFSAGGTRDWASLLSTDDVAHFDERMRLLCGDATRWALAGRAGLRQVR